MPLISKLNRAALATVASLGLAVPMANAQSLTRVETHGFYGATVTVEEGVRVFRPLPSTGHMIINPDGRTPVSLNISESVHHYVGPNGGGIAGGGGAVAGAHGGLPLGLGQGGGRGHQGKASRYMHTAGGKPVGSLAPAKARMHGGHAH